MTDFRDLARDPKHCRGFEKLVYIATQRGDADIVAERLSWGIDPNCTSPKGRTPLIANVRGSNPSAATVLALLQHGADPRQTDLAGLDALAYARRKLARLQSRPTKPQRKSPSLDENNQILLSDAEQKEIDSIREELKEDTREYLQYYWNARLRAARRVFNDPSQVEQNVAILEAVAGTE